jgi:hypothetical protein
MSKRVKDILETRKEVFKNYKTKNYIDVYPKMGDIILTPIFKMVPPQYKWKIIKYNRPILSTDFLPEEWAIGKEYSSDMKEEITKNGIQKQLLFKNG